MNKIIYISGAYRSRWGLIGRIINIWRARRVAQQLWRGDWIVICPHMNTALFPEDGIDYISRDCEIVKRCDAIYLLKSWEDSVGARRELAVALANELEVYWE